MPRPIDLAGAATLLLFALSSPAAAELETLAPETARSEVGASRGIVVVDLFAEW
jgi:hypothetical protein